MVTGTAATAGAGISREAGPPLRVLMVTSEWPSPETPHTSPFLVAQVDFLRRAGVAVDVFSFRGARRLRNYARAWWRLRARIDPRRYDLIHAQYGQAGLLPWPRRLPVVVTFHGCDLLGDKDHPDGRVTLAGRILRQLSRLEARFADGAIIVSRTMLPHLPAGVQPLLLPTGVDLQSIPRLTPAAARRALELPEDARLVLFVGNPAVHEKRFELAEEAVEILRRRLEAQLVVGWGRSRHEILLLMCACDALVVSSWQEASPTVVKEALACRLPVVSVPVGDVPERLAGVDGCEVCADDRAQTIAAALERVLARGERLGDGLTHELDERVLADKLIGFYQRVLAQDAERNRR